MRPRIVNIKSAFVSQVLPLREVQPQRPQVEIHLSLRDTLNILGEGPYRGQTLMRQCCYEQNTISMDPMLMDPSQEGHREYVNREVHQALQENMHMDPSSAEKACPKVASTIIELVETTNRSHPSFGTISLAIYIDCSMARFGGEHGGPIGEHGYRRLLRRESEICSLCQRRFSSSWEIAVTTCHHAYHRECICQWFDNSSSSCPICQLDLALMVHGPLRLEP
ncbi:uncharacterized protein LOC116247410 [Nymphaea colorata]|uniref:uncharacterized protein LOC116247410 n=1 Tax=Nymphaea colorata TaxID=210225 RepID=UPI00129E0D60|nr:uncharacterized protein LOC116247410 [Nymphaea colorata]